MKHKLHVMTIVAVTTLAGLAACGKPPASPTAAPTPTSAPAGEDELARIRAAGKIIVGTSSGYPPFEFMTDDFQLDGFDIALIREIGRRLGVAVDIKDFAFEGLIAALRVRQIDVSIAAMAATPERAEKVDFSAPYYQGMDGILAREDSNLSIVTTAEDMAGYKIGVQRGTLYETWVQETLIGTGKITPSDLLAYARVEQAVRDLKDRRVDMVVMDYMPAQDYVKQGGVKLVGQGLHKHEYVIAIRKGAGSLQAELNRLITQLRQEGFIDQLARQYLAGQ